MSDDKKIKGGETSTNDHLKVSEIILSAQDELVKDLAARRHAVHDDMLTQYGVEREKHLEYSAYEVSCLANAIATANPGLFTEYIDWVKAMFKSKDIPLTALEQSLELVQESMLSGLPHETHKIITRFIQAGMDELRGPSSETSSFIDTKNTHGELAQQYLDVVLAGDRATANRLVMKAFNGGLSIFDIYFHVLQPVQYEIGRLWQTNRISVAQEHFVSGVTQVIMSQLYYPHICDTKKTGKKMVAVCVSGELHEIGIRMISDLFEMEGWDVYLLGANMPVYDIVESLLTHEADVLGISAAMASSINKVEKIVARVKASEASSTSIIVGGFAFKQDVRLWKLVGADYYAGDAKEALQTAKQLGD